MTKMTTRVFPLLLTAVAACKPTPFEQSTVLESGGTPADWRVTAMLSAVGELRVDRAPLGGATGTATSTFVPTSTVVGTATGTSLLADSARIASVVLELAQAPSGAVTDANLRATRYMDMTAGGAEIRMNLLMRMRDNRLCYANAIPLSGTNQPVICKEAADAVGTGVLADDPTKRRADLAATCERLSLTKAQWDREIFVARFDRQLETCMCLTGREHELRYADYQTRERDERLFEADCRRDPSVVAGLPGIGTGTGIGTSSGIGTSTGIGTGLSSGLGSGVATGVGTGPVVAAGADPIVVCRDLVTRTCNDGGRSGTVIEEYDGCRCGDTLLRYDDFRGRADKLSTECLDRAFAGTLVPDDSGIRQRAVCP